MPCGKAAPVPCVDLLMPHGEHLLHGCDSSAGEAIVVLAHFDGLQPLWHRLEHGTIPATCAGQADGHTAGKKQKIIIIMFIIYSSYYPQWPQANSVNV